MYKSSSPMTIPGRNTNQQQYASPLPTNSIPTISPIASPSEFIAASPISPTATCVTPATKSTQRLEDFRFLKKIGSGSYSEVYLASHKQTGEQLAVKVIERKKSKQNFLLNELRSMTAIQNQNSNSIVKYYGKCADSTYLYIFMEYLNGKNMSNVVEDSVLEKHQVRTIFKQMCEAVSACHAQGICHHDIKLENFVLHSDPSSPNSLSVKLIDFGFSVKVSQSLNHLCGSPLFNAPELFFGSLHNEKVDVYSLGVVLYLMLTGKFPYEAKTFRELQSKMQNPKPVYYPDYLTDEEIAVLSLLLQMDAAKRPGIDQILMHSYFCEYRMDIL